MDRNTDKGADMNTTIDAEIDRECVPAGSFRYGQAASFDGVDAPLDAWLVATNCSKAKNESDNGASGFDTVLCVHFIFTDEADARACVANISQPVTLVHPIEN